MHLPAKKRHLHVPTCQHLLNDCKLVCIGLNLHLLVFSCDGLQSFIPTDVWQHITVFESHVGRWRLLNWRIIRREQKCHLQQTLMSLSRSWEAVQTHRWSSFWLQRSALEEKSPPELNLSASVEDQQPWCSICRHGTSYTDWILFIYLHPIGCKNPTLRHIIFD